MNEQKPTNNDKLKEAGNLIKAKRLSLNKSLRAFAKEYGISSSVLNQLELGNIKTPSMKTISALANALDMPIISLCSMYSIPIDDNCTCENESKPIDPKQNLIEALFRYGIHDSYIDTALDYINYLKYKTQEDKQSTESIKAYRGIIGKKQEHRISRINKSGLI